MKSVLFLFVALPLAAQTLPPVPSDPALPVEPLLTVNTRSPKHAEFLASTGARMVKRAAVISPLPVIMLTWDYPADQLASVQFELWHCSDLSQVGAQPLTHYDQVPPFFTLLSTVDAPPVTVPQQAQDFFICRAKDRVSGLYSNWNQVVSK